MLRLEAVLRGGPETRLQATVLFLQSSGERHEAADREIEVGPVRVAELAREPLRREFSFGLDEGGTLQGRVALRAEPISPDLTRIRLCVHNETRADR